MGSYEYPPSSHLLNHGPIEPKSHFFVQGVAHFDDSDVDCEFEVAYTQNCHIMIILYIKFEQFQDLYMTKSVNGADVSYSLDAGPIRNSTIRKLSGKAVQSNSNIEVEDCSLLNLGFGEMPLVFRANRLKVINTVPYATEHSVGSTFEIMGLDIPTKFLNVYDFSVGDNGEHISIEPIAVGMERDYDNQAIAKLVIPSNAVVTGWTDDQVASLWCAMMSLALGQDIRWINSSLLNSETEVVTTWVRHSQVFGQQKINRLIPSFPYDLSDKRLAKFIKSIFASISRGDVSATAASDYIEAVHRYVQYQMITTQGLDQARLITTSIEELVNKWQQHSGLPFEPLVTEVELAALLLRADDDMKAWFSDIITTGTAEESNLSKRRKALRGKVKSYLKNELVRSSFEDRLKVLFRENTSTPWFTAHVKSRLSPFVVTRNYVVHGGGFPTERTKEWYWYYYNMLMILPLIVFALFRYNGAYIDLIQEWAHIVEEPS